VQGLEQKLNELRLTIPAYSGKSIPFVEMLCVTSDLPLIVENEKDDLDRESQFYKQALRNTLVAAGLYSSEGLPYKKPEDFFAEMIKTDEHMELVKGSLLKEKREIDEATVRRKIRTQKKYGKQIQLNVLQQRKKQRDDEKETIKNWIKKRKNNLGGDDSDLEVIFDPNANKKKMSSNAQRKNDKYGFGGKKKGLKKMIEPAIKTTKMNGKTIEEKE